MYILSSEDSDCVSTSIVAIFINYLTNTYYKLKPWRDMI